LPDFLSIIAGKTKPSDRNRENGMIDNKLDTIEHAPLSRFLYATDSGEGWL
jgi:hypothetical protein